MREAKLVLPRVHAAAIGIGVAWGLACLFLIPALWGRLGSSVGAGGPTLVAAAAGALAAWWTRRAYGTRDAKIEVEGGRLRVEADRAVMTFAPEDIAGALVVPSGDGERLHVFRKRGGPIVLAFARHGDGASVLAEVARAGGAARFELASEGGRIAAACVGGAFGGVIGMFAGLVASATTTALTSTTAPGWAAGVAIASLCVWAGAQFFGRMLPEITIGEDGLSWRSGATPKVRFAPFSDFDAISVSEVRQKQAPYYQIHLHLAGGKRHVIATFAAHRRDESTAIVEKLEAAWARWRNEAPASRSALVFDRPASSTKGWIDRLRELAPQRPNYRTSSLADEQLLAILENAAAPPRHRIGAAVVLRQRGDDASLERIRIAADATANPALRLALSSVATEDDIEATAVTEAIEAASSG